MLPGPEEPSKKMGLKGLSSNRFGKAELIDWPLTNVLVFHVQGRPEILRAFRRGHIYVSTILHYVRACM